MSRQIFMLCPACGEYAIRARIVLYAAEGREKQGHRGTPSELTRSGDGPGCGPFVGSRPALGRSNGIVAAGPMV
jgi:hypothetical protein